MISDQFQKTVLSRSVGGDGMLFVNEPLPIQKEELIRGNGLMHKAKSVFF